MQTALREDTPCTQISLDGIDRAVCQGKVVDINHVRHRTNPNKYAKGVEREKLMGEINQYMLRGMPAHQIAQKYGVGISTIYTWMNEVKQHRVEQLEKINMESIIADLLAHRKESTRLLYEIIDNPKSSDNSRIKALAELRLANVSLLDLLKGTRAFGVLMEKLGFEPDQSEKDGKALQEMLGFFLHGLNSEMSGHPVDDDSFMSQEKHLPLDQSFIY